MPEQTNYLFTRPLKVARPCVPFSIKTSIQRCNKNVIGIPTTEQRSKRGPESIMLVEGPLE
jgi:hypothetical protein